MNRYMAAAHHAATVLYDRRSPLGLVGSSFHVGANTWTHLGSTIGPGSDSYYEYLLKVECVRVRVVCVCGVMVDVCGW